MVTTSDVRTAQHEPLPPGASRARLRLVALLLGEVTLVAALVGARSLLVPAPDELRGDDVAPLLALTAWLGALLGVAWLLAVTAVAIVTAVPGFERRLPRLARLVPPALVRLARAAIVPIVVLTPLTPAAADPVVRAPASAGVEAPTVGDAADSTDAADPVVRGVAPPDDGAGTGPVVREGTDRAAGTVPAPVVRSTGSPTAAPDRGAASAATTTVPATVGGTASPGGEAPSPAEPVHGTGTAPNGPLDGSGSTAPVGPQPDPTDPRGRVAPGHATAAEPTELPRYEHPTDAALGQPSRAAAAAVEHRHHVVVPGDNLWTIAAGRLAAHLGRTPANAEIVPYWQQVIARNLPTLRSGNPNLIHPGEVVELPPVA